MGHPSHRPNAAAAWSRRPRSLGREHLGEEGRTAPRPGQASSLPWGHMLHRGGREETPGVPTRWGTAVCYPQSNYLKNYCKRRCHSRCCKGLHLLSKPTMSTSSWSLWGALRGRYRLCSFPCPPPKIRACVNMGGPGPGERKAHPRFSQHLGLTRSPFIRRTAQPRTAPSGF